MALAVVTNADVHPLIQGLSCGLSLGSISEFTSGIMLFYEGVYLFLFHCSVVCIDSWQYTFFTLGIHKLPTPSSNGHTRTGCLKKCTGYAVSITATGGDPLWASHYTRAWVRT